MVEDGLDVVTTAGHLRSVVGRRGDGGAYRGA